MKTITKVGRFQKMPQLCARMSENSPFTKPPDDPESLEDAISTLRAFTGLALFCFEEHGSGLRDQISKNFVARGMSCLDSIHVVWKNGSEQDAWILHRALVDRLLHLRSLDERDDFDEFDAYSFKWKYDARNRLLSDTYPQMKAKVTPGLKKLQKSNTPRYNQIVKSGVNWRRPDAKDMAKGMKLHFLYTLGYDYASTHVHPMADDGEADFRRLTSPTQTGPIPDATVVLNSILVQVLLTQSAFNVSSMRWRRIAHDFLGNLLSYLEANQVDYRVTFVKIGRAGPDFRLCAPTKNR